MTRRRKPLLANVDQYAKVAAEGAMPDRVWTAIAALVIGLVSWMLLQQIDTRERVAIIESNEKHHEATHDILSTKILPLLERAKK